MIFVVRHLHEGDRPARCPLHHQPDLRNLRDNHCTCFVPETRTWPRGQAATARRLRFNLAESADYIFDHAIFNDCMANVDFCEQMVKRPTVAAGQGRDTSAPGSDIPGYKTIADIMRALNPFTGEFYLETCTWRVTRARCIACSAVATRTPRRSCLAAAALTSRHQTCTDYYVRYALLRLRQRSRPMHDDLYDFFLTELPGYDMVRYRKTPRQLGCFDDPTTSTTRTGT